MLWINELIQHSSTFIGAHYYLQSDIMDVNQIFKDLSVLVHEQGDIVGKCFRNN